MNRPHVLIVYMALCCVAWMDPTPDRIAKGNRFFTEGNFDKAIRTYGEALVDDPDSPVLNYNMGTAHYKAEKYVEALASFARVQASNTDPQQQAKVAYNTGNTHYRLGAAAETGNPQGALAEYTNALAAYRRALGADPTDQDAKFNYEFVSKKIEELQEKLAEHHQHGQHSQQSQQGHPPDQEAEQQEDPQHQQQTDQQHQQAQKNNADDQEKHAQQPQADARKETQVQQEREAQRAAAESKEQLMMSPEEAAALIDMARSDELRPDEFVRQAQGAAVAEPAEDW